MEEVEETILSIQEYSSLGPDGFRSKFYMTCRAVHKDDVLEVVQDFL